MPRILHIASQNFAGVPYDFFRMHNACGDYSRLVTMHANQIDFKEDICLGLPLPTGKLAMKWRRSKMLKREEEKLTAAPVFAPKNVFERLYFAYDDARRRPVVREAIRKYELDSFDIIHFDSGLDLYRNSSAAKRWKSMGKKIVCCYYGSDLRLRGVIPAMDEISDLNITSEFDHLELKSGLHYIFYPYDTSEVPLPLPNTTGRTRIIHTPTNRKYKGTELILGVIEQIKLERDIEFILLEKRPRSEVLEAKRGCDICIDQVGGSMGGTGYGKAGIETLAMGIPVVTNFTAAYEAWLPENPFIVANDAQTLREKLLTLIDNADERKQKGAAGKTWVEKFHGFASVKARLKELYALKGIA